MGGKQWTRAGACIACVDAPSMLRRRAYYYDDPEFFPDSRPLPRAKDADMNFTLSLGPLVSLVAGVLILIVPRLLNFIVAGYLIIVGLLGLLGGMRM